jgi:hypothetical protein
MEGEESTWRVIRSADCVICHVKLQPQVCLCCDGFFYSVRRYMRGPLMSMQVLQQRD